MKTFQEVFNEERDGSEGHLLTKMGVLNESGEFLIDDTEWDIARKLD